MKLILGQRQNGTSLPPHTERDHLMVLVVVLNTWQHVQVHKNCRIFNKLFHAKSSQFITQSSQISMKVGELVDFIENSILAKFSRLCQFLWCRGAKTIKNYIFWHAASTKIIITFVSY
jgi:hypothetical protein